MTTMYQNCSVGFVNGKFVSGNLFIQVEAADGKVLAEHHVTIRNYQEAMNALRRVERAAGHAARMVDTVDHTRLSQWHYTGKFVDALTTC